VPGQTSNSWVQRGCLGKGVTNTTRKPKVGEALNIRGSSKGGGKTQKNERRENKGRTWGGGYRKKTKKREGKRKMGENKPEMSEGKGKRNRENQLKKMNSLPEPDYQKRGKKKA